MKPPLIIATRDYNQFKIHSSNRQINNTHLKRLMINIGRRNLLHLFPIVVNKQKEVIEGQHRLTAARELGVDLFYIIDDTITQLDIAMVNNNRKQWSQRDYIHFHSQEGNKPMQNLKWLLENYPKCSVIGGVKLMRSDTKRYWEKVTSIGGGTDSVHLKEGKISDEDFDNAKKTCEIAKEACKHIPYIFRPDLLLDLKKIFVENNLTIKFCKEQLASKARMFPKNSTFYDLTASRMLWDVLVPGVRGGGGGGTRRSRSAKYLIITEKNKPWKQQQNLNRRRFSLKRSL